MAQSFEYLMPSVMEVVKAQSSRNRPDRAIECVEFFEALLFAYPRVICSNLKSVIDGLLRAAIFLNVNEISCRFMNVISTIISYKSKVRNDVFLAKIFFPFITNDKIVFQKIAKEEVVLQTLCQTLYEIIKSPKLQDENKDHYDVFSGDVNLANAAVDLLDTLAVEIEPELLMKHVVSASLRLYDTQENCLWIWANHCYAYKLINLAYKKSISTLHCVTKQFFVCWPF